MFCLPALETGIIDNPRRGEMNMNATTRFLLVLPVAAVAFILSDVGPLGLAVPFVFAHCDTMDGPVIAEAQKALEAGDITPVLKWVREEDEPVIRETFARALSVRTLGTAASELADRYFFETLVRVHREAEGAPYTGLKPKGTGISPAEMAADKAIEQGSVDKLAGEIGDKLRNEIVARFHRVREKKKHADDSVQAGREYVEAYVRYVHFVDGVHTMIAGHGAEHGAAGHGH
jgi:hypothetical protein